MVLCFAALHPKTAGDSGMGAWVTIEASIITSTIVGVLYFNYRIKGTKTLF